MSIQIEQLTVAIDGVLVKVNVNRRVLAGDGGDLDASERARVDLLQVVVRQAQPLEAVEVREGLGRDELQIVVGQIECAQVDVVLEVVLAESQSVARQVQVLKIKIPMKKNSYFNRELAVLYQTWSDLRLARACESIRLSELRLKSKL